MNRQQWVKDEEGAAAIEFSLLVWPFVMLIVGILELAVMFTSAALLEVATDRASRDLRTGEIQQSFSDPEDQMAAFRDGMCEFAEVMINCEAMIIEAVPLSGFDDYSNFGVQYDDDGNLDPLGFAAGGSNDVMLVRTSFVYTLLTPMIGNLMGERGTNTRMFFSTIVLKVEPYDEG